MGPSAFPYPLALIVEDDVDQRELLALLFEESDMHVLECESAEAALSALELYGEQIVLLFTDVQLVGAMDGADLALVVRHRYPGVKVIVTSGRDRPATLPADAMFMPKPWYALDVLREAAASMHVHMQPANE